MLFTPAQWYPLRKSIQLNSSSCHTILIASHWAIMIISVFNASNPVCLGGSRVKCHVWFFSGDGDRHDLLRCVFMFDCKLQTQRKGGLFISFSGACSDHNGSLCASPILEGTGHWSHTHTQWYPSSSHSLPQLKEAQCDHTKMHLVLLSHSFDSCYITKLDT